MLSFEKANALKTKYMPDMFRAKGILQQSKYCFYLNTPTNIILILTIDNMQET